MNSTVFEYHEGHAQARKTSKDKEKTKRYTRRCFVMSRTVLQFHKFARFDPRGTPLNDKELAARVRIVTHKQPWHEALPAEQRIVFPGYRDLRALSVGTRSGVAREHRPGLANVFSRRQFSHVL